MNWNREEVSRLLNAKITDEEAADGSQFTIIHFEDTRMRYEIYVTDRGVFIAADPERPVQGLPFFEISLSCTDLAPIPRSGMPTGVGVYSGRISSDSLRFSITRREDGIISLSGAWEGLESPAMTATTPNGER